MIDFIEEEGKRRYKEDGVQGVIDYGETLGLNNGFCAPCDVYTPIYKGHCLVCGTAYPPFEEAFGKLLELLGAEGGGDVVYTEASSRTFLRMLDFASQGGVWVTNHQEGPELFLVKQTAEKIPSARFNLVVKKSGGWVSWDAVQVPKDHPLSWELAKWADLIQTELIYNGYVYLSFD